MVFSNSLSDYFDPSNWPQEGNQQQYAGIIPTTDHPLEIRASPPAPVTGSGGSGLNRPGSMLDRARIARVPLPEPGLKCPRCESFNTKFCYFNNYNLSQPRHFCKTCRRYWTRGGALRNVPVGGGYRRNKRSKGRTKSASAQPHPAQRNSGGGGDSSNNTALLIASVNANTNANPNGFCSQLLLPPPPSSIPSSHHLKEYKGGFKLNLGGGGAAEFEMGGTSSSGVSRVHQLSNLLNGSTGVTGNGLYPTLTFHQDQSNTSTANELNHDHTSRSGFGSQVSRVKPEDDSHGTNLSKNFMMGIRQANGDHDDDDQYHNWGLGNGWTEISGFQAPSSAGNLF